MTDIFISYSRKDKTFVQLLHDAIAAENRDAWVDWEDIPLTADWWAEIQEGIEAADTFVFVISPDSASSEVCNQELDHAANLKKRIVPIVYRDTEDVPKKLKHLNWVFCRESDDFDSAFKALMETMDTDLEWVKAHTRLTQRAVEWDKKTRSDSYLLRGEDLNAAEQMMTKTDKEPQLTDLQAQYIVTSRKSTTRRQRRTLAAVVAGWIVTIILGIVVFYQFLNTRNAYLEAERQWAETQMEEASAQKLHEELQESLSRELAANAILNYRTDPQLSILLAVQAVSKSRTTEAVEALKQVMEISENMEIENLLELAQRRLTRSLSEDECKKYLRRETCPEYP